MACFDENTVLAFFASPRESGVALRVDAHAADCKPCRDLLAAYAALGEGDASVGSLAPASTVNLASTVAAPAPPGDSLARRLAEAQAARRVGQLLGGKWRIEKLLGIGGMAQVFAARHRNGKPVAVKLMRPQLAVEPALVQRFLREAYLANRVAHPGAVPVHDDGATEDGVPFLVMDLLEGRTLRERLVQSGPLSIEEGLRVIDQVVDVLAAAHAKGIVHRDIKPENLFETSDGVVRVLDFGIARLMEPGEGMTHSGVTMGTVGYMPPEQARGQMALVDARSDLWAVGATLFNLLTGRAVHEASTHNEVLLLAMTAKVPPVRSLAPALPVALAQVLDRALAFDKAARWDDAGAMQRALRSALVPATETPPVRRRGIAWSGGVVVVALGALLVARASGDRGASAAPRGSPVARVSAPSATAPSPISIAPFPEPAPVVATLAGPGAPPPIVDKAPASHARTAPKVAPPAIAPPRAASSAPPPGAPPPRAAPSGAMNPLGPRT